MHHTMEVNVVLHQAHGAAPLWSAWQRGCSQSLPCCCSALYKEQADCVPARRVLAEVLQLLVGSSPPHLACRP